MILEIVQLILGLVLGLFLPGFLLTKIIFSDISLLETLAFSVVFSILIDIILGLFMGASEMMYFMTGGLTGFNVWFYMIILTIILGFIYLAKSLSKWKKRPKFTSFLTKKDVIPLLSYNNNETFK